MTPNDIEVLIHCHVSPTVHPRHEAPAVKRSILWMLDKEIIKQCSYANQYRTTGKGKALIKMLCDTPIPKKCFVDPRSGEEVPHENEPQ